MTIHPLLFNFLHTLCFWICVVILIPILGLLWSQLVQGKRTPFHFIFGWLENASYRIAGIDPNEEMGWTTYAWTLILFNLCGGIVLFFLLVFQAYLPLNPQTFAGVSWTTAVNIAASFMTNTDWQSYAGETSLSYGSQMFGLTVQNFLSAATGSAVLMALVRGIVRQSSKTIGNFWADLVRSVFYLLLPLSIFMSIFLVSQGVVQTFSPYQTIQTLENKDQTIPLGPVASQVAIKQIGTNGGGFFNANSAHPFENPTSYSNFFEMIFLLAVPASMVYGYGVLIDSRKHAWFILGVMFVLWLIGFSLASYAEAQKNPILEAYPLWEGKEVRLGNINSLLWSTMTTASSNGSTNMALESLSPLAAGTILFNMMIGEVVFGGIGTGLCNMLMHLLLAVFLCGLMIGRTPEYRGKKLEKFDIQWIVFAILAPSALILLGAGISSVLPVAQASLSEYGPNGLTELIYAFTSAAMNNGSAFEGLKANTTYFNLTLALVMLLGRLVIIIPSLILAGSFAAKKIVPKSAGTLPTSSLLFGVILCSIIIVVGSLIYLPALSLGPIVEHLLMIRGQTFSTLGGG